MRSGEVEKWRSGEWQNGEVARALPICMVLTLISISRRIDSDDSIGVKLLLYSSMCCRVYQYSEAGSNAFGGVVALWLFVQKSMKKARKKLKVEKEWKHNCTSFACGCIYTAPDLSSKSGT